MTEPQAATELGGRYRLEDRIAAGGMGVVWQAHDNVLDRPVAVKVLSEALADDPRFVERFRREAQAAAGLSHPNIAGVFDYGEEDGRPYIVMELIEGETLAQRLDGEGPLPPDEAARIGAAVAEALAAAHAAGIVHRDVKPANVMLTPRGDVRVMDFGIAAPSAGTGLTGTGMVMGTARYISPEQAVGGRAMPASDLYSLGAVLFEMLTGRPVFDRETPVATAMAHVQDDPPRVEAVRPEVPANLAGLVNRCLAKDRADRPKDAATLAAALRGDTEPSPEATTAVLPAPDSTAQLPVAAGVGAAAEPAAAPSGGAAPAGAPSVTGPRRGRHVRDRRPVAVLAGLVVVAVLAFVIAAAVGGGGLKTIRTPDFRGMEKARAGAVARGHSLTPVFLPVEPQPATVVRQKPAPGSRIAAGSSVVLFVSPAAPAPAVTTPPGPSPPPPKDHGKGKDHKGPGHGKGP